jgi:hypothetical protein
LEYFNKTKKHTSCKHISSSLFFDYKNNIKLCPCANFSLVEQNYNGIWLDINKINSKRNEILSSFEKNEINEQCSNCIYLEQNNKPNNNFIQTLYLSNWKNCYLNCIYCKAPKEEDLVKANHYDIFSSIKQLIDAKLITKKTKIVFQCGDSTIHPEFDKILFFFINYEMEDIEIHTPALRYCESISQAIAKNIVNVYISFDCACPYIYKKVKGTNKFDITINNTKRYLAFQEPNQNRIAFEYTIIEGVNDNQKEIIDLYVFSQELGIQKLLIDIEEEFFNKIKKFPPKYLKELIIFIKNISIYNNSKIEFSQKLEYLYAAIKEEKIN